MRITRVEPLHYPSIAPLALVYSHDERAHCGRAADEGSDEPAAFITRARTKMTGPRPLEEDLKLVKYRNSYWVVLEPEGIPLVEFAAQHIDTLGEPLYEWMKTRLSRDTILEFHADDKFDWQGFKKFMESKGWDISRNEPGIINA